MSWLFPLYLAGALAVLGPILLHLRRQPPKKKVAFSTLMFLDEAAVPPVQRRRLERWVLLAVRCLLVVALALLFARPWWRSRGAVAGEGAGEAVMILVDGSASMRREGLWGRAVEEVVARVGALGAADEVAVGVYGTEVEWGWSFDEGREPERAAAIGAWLRGREPGWGSTDLGAALVAGLEGLGGRTGGGGVGQRVVVVSDFQEGTEMGGLRGMVWPEEVGVELVGLETEPQANLTLSSVPRGGERWGQEESEGMKVRVWANGGDANYELRWRDDAGGAGVRGRVLEGGQRVVTVPLPPRVDGPQVLELKGDGWEVDNELHWAPPEAQVVGVAVYAKAGSEMEAATPAFYLKRALTPTARLQPEWSWVTGEASGEGAAKSALWVYPGDGQRLSAGEVEQWLTGLKAGGLGVYVVDGGEAAGELERLTGGLEVAVSERKMAAGDYELLGELATAHALLRPFADARLQDFSRVRFWKSREVTLPEGEGVEVLARWEDGVAAWWSVTVGEGRLVVLSAGWHPAESQLALSTKFVPLWYGWLEAAGFANRQGQDLRVGDELPLGEAERATVVTPEGGEVEWLKGQVYRVKQPGVYEVRTATGRQWQAVQMDPAEGRLSPMDPAAFLAEWGLNAAETAGEGAGAVRERVGDRVGVVQEAEQQAWGWLAWLVLLTAGVETWLAGRGAKPAQSAPMAA